MSFVTTIDTLQFSNRMQKAGLNKKVSDELAEVIKESQGQSLENVATKYDLEILRQDLKLLEHKIIIKLGSLTALGVAILAALIKL